MSETQKLLDELRSPGALSVAEAKAEMIEALDVMERIDMQAQRIESRFRRAMLSEADPAVAGKFEEGRQLFAALRREVNDYRRAHDEMLGTLEAIPRWLNGVEEEREVPDEAEHDSIRAELRDTIAAAREADPELGDRMEAAVGRLMPALMHVRNRGIKRPVRTDGFRHVAERAGYDPWPAREAPAE